MFEILSDLNRRIDRLEAGRKPMAKISEAQEQSFSLASGASSVRHFTFAWSNTNITLNPKGIFYHDLYIDSVLQAETAMSWYPENRLNSELNKSHAHVWVENPSGSTRSYKVVGRWVYFAGGTGA